MAGASLGAFGDAVLTALAADATFSALVGGRIVATTKISTSTVYPYVVGERRDLLSGSVAMQREGGQGSIWLDTWSELNTPDEAHRIQARARAVLNRGLVLAMVGYTMSGGSLKCDEERVFSDFDQDMPQRGLYHGVQHFIADLEEAL